MFFDHSRHQFYRPQFTYVWDQTENWVDKYDQREQLKSVHAAENESSSNGIFVRLDEAVPVKAIRV
jgi:hypothetical protein